MRGRKAPNDRPAGRGWRDAVPVSKRDRGIGWRTTARRRPCRERARTRDTMNAQTYDDPDDLNAIRRVRDAAIEGDREARKRLKDAARSVERAEQQETVDGCMAALKDALADCPDTPPTDLLFSVCDGQIIGYSNARAYLRASDNADAYAENIGGDDPGVEARATYALETDVRERVRREHGGLEALAEHVHEEGSA